MKEIEIISKRKPREKHFLREDGSIVAKIYSDDVHYLKNGKYEEIDNELIETEEYIENKSNDYRVKFKKQIKSSLMRMEKDEYFIDIKLKNSSEFSISKNKQKSKSANSITYKNIKENTDIEYKILPSKVKETIILYDNSKSFFTFVVDTNLKLSKENDNIIAENSGKLIFTIDKPYMVDSNDVRNDNVFYNLRKVDKGYELDLILDKDWLDSNNTKYPVYVDPTISNNSQSVNLYDTYIYQGDTNDQRSNRAYLKAGVERISGANRINRTLIKFDLPTLGTGSEIVYAAISLTPYPTSTQDPTPRIATIHRLTSDWNESTANWNNMHDKYEERVESMFYGSRSTIVNNTIIPAVPDYDGNITNLVKKWYRGTPNYGIMLKSLDETTYVDDDYPMFYSKDNSYSNDNNPKPLITLVYRNHNGLEDYLDYRIQEFESGKAYVNTYNGNLTTVFNIGYTVGGNFPVGLDLIYNTNDVILNNETFFKKGYKLNLEQIIESENIDNTNYLKYLDEDGTIHYFTQDSSSDNYKDEDGLNLTVEKTDLLCNMYDNEGNSMVFTKIGDLYRLTRITDTDGNFINIVLNQDNSINKITDKYGSEVSIAYNSNNIIITSPSTTTTLNYTNNLLTSIETLSGEIDLEYNSNNIVSGITDTNGLKIRYEYYANSPYRLYRITQVGIDNQDGAYFTLEYGFDSTSIIDSSGKTTTLIYNPYGNLLSANSLTSGEDIDNAYSINQTYGNNTENKNRILSNEIPIKHIKNYLKNASFESDISYFQIDEDHITKSYSTDEYISGNRSLKLETLTLGQSIEQTIEVPKGKYYTFSGYFKTDEDIEIKLLYSDSENNDVVSSEIIKSCNEFDRNDVTIYYDENASSNLKILICFPNISTVYVDDIQLEEGQIANGFNMIENSDFSEGYSDWDLNAWTYDGSTINAANSFSTINFNNNNSTALKVSTKPSYGVSFSKILPVKGKRGDLYTCSFWYKNLGIPGYGQIAGSAVSIYFKPVGEEAEYCIGTSDYFNPNEDKWQFFTYRAHAPEDFESIKLVFLIGREANDFYLTNLSLYKNVTSGDYNYDNNGNLISITDQNNNTDIFKYDTNNQLIEMTDSKGKNFIYEYDNNKTDRVLSAISSTGISNRIIYDSNGNPITTKISKKFGNSITTGLYKIRNKGTNKYLKAELSMVLLEENECSNTVWRLEKNGDYYKIIYNVQPDYTISYRGNQLVLDTEDTNNLFEIEKNTDNSNGTYYIKYNETTPTGTNVRFFTADNTNINAQIYTEQSSNIESYIELCEDIFIENNASYTADGKFLKSVINSDFKEVNYSTNVTNGLLNYIDNGNNRLTEYTHNNKNQITQIKRGNKIISYEYNNKNKLTKIMQNNKTFNLGYDNFLNLCSVNLNNNINLINNTYDNDGNILQINYGNNSTISYSYDDFNRVCNIQKMDNIGSYHYDNNGHLSKVYTTYNNYKYYYDVANRLYKYIDNDLRIDMVYDDDDFVIQKKYKMDNFNNNININYVDELPTCVDIDSDQITYTYDSLDRVISKNINNLYTIYYNYKSNGKRTTDIIETYTIDGTAYDYKYDDFGNIIYIYSNNNVLNKYEYDDYNELVKETDYSANKYIEYTYNSSGNMTNRTVRSLLDDSIIEQNTLAYDNSDWEDQLTEYDNEIINYDSVGNVNSINNATLSWINGKELSTYSDSVNNLDIRYKYNINGIRISKTINGVETKYYLDGNNIVFEKKNNNTIYYLYDLDGIIGFKYNGNNYYYIKNYNNDIIGILNNLGQKVVTYEYDSWGNVLSIKDINNNEVIDTTHIGYINPFRFRSYYYDVETKLYYLNTRYYNPKWGKFMSPDSAIGANQDALSNNLYLYVSNNPINNIDADGNLIIALIVTALVASAIKKSKKQSKKTKTKKVKTTNKSNSKIIPSVTVTAKKAATVPVMNSVLRTVAVDYSKQSGGAGTSTVHKTSSPLTLDIGYNPSNILETTLSLSLSTPFGTISKTTGLFANATSYSGNWKKVHGEKERKVWEVGNNFYSFYADIGKDTFISKDSYSYNYDRYTVSKLVVAIAVLAPEVLEAAGKVNLVGLKYQLINDLIKTAGAIIGTRAAA